MKEPTSCTTRTETIHRVSPQPIVKSLYEAKEHKLGYETTPMDGEQLRDRETAPSDVEQLRERQM